MTSLGGRQVRFCWLFQLVIFIVCITQQSLCAYNYTTDSPLAEPEEAPPTPVFSKNYHVNGLLSLPYAELNEPFEAWFDSNKGKSRTEYYGDLYKIYQFGPTITHRFGSMYKLAYVPKNFYQDKKRVANDEKPVKKEQKHQTLDQIMKILRDIENDIFNYTESKDNKAATVNKTVINQKQQSSSTDDAYTRRACFVAEGGVGNTIGPQTVLPNLEDFTFDSIVPCPHVGAFEHRHMFCELWKLENLVIDKRNVYKFWVRRDNATGEVIPVHYYMLGFDTLLGSHYDRYDISYFNYKPNGALDSDFEFDPSSLKCGPMPGPGDGSPALRMHRVLSNPIHEYVVEPHRYDHIDHEFGNYRRKHNAGYYSSMDMREGWHRFLHNFRLINSKNRELKNYKLTVNKFTGRPINELRRLRGRFVSKGYNGGKDYMLNHRSWATGKLAVDHLPESLDWGRLGAVTPVKDQAVCGSCWSFGTSGTIEGAYFVKRQKERGDGKLLKLSQQQMIDCSWKFGNNGCDGGEDFRAYKYIEDAGGLATEEEYGKYMGIDGQCREDAVEKAVKISGFFNVTMNDVDALKHALYHYGPVTVAIDASQPTFTFYSHGVYYDPKCHNSPDQLDHQVLVVGYTHIDGQLVWIVKNSWSTYWGDDGYIMMAAKDNNCGVMDAPTVPIIDLGDSDEWSFSNSSSSSSSNQTLIGA